MKKNKLLKEELRNYHPDNRCCILTALKVSFRLYGNLHLKNKKYILEFKKNKLALMRRIVRLFKIVFKTDYKKEISYDENKYWVNIEVNKDILAELDIYSSEDEFLPEIKLENFCCKKSFVKELILYKGYLFDFKDSYQLEIRADNPFQKKLSKILNGFNIKDYEYNDRIFIKGFKNLKKLFFLLGLKDVLKSLIEFSSYRKDKDKSIRLTNYSMANLTRQVNSFEKYKKIIEKIDRKRGIDNLPEKLEEIAYVRLKNPDASYAELGERLENPITKGGVQKRLKKLEDIYEEIGG